MTMLLDPRLADCRRIFLNGLCVQASIGFHAHERQQAQRLRMNLIDGIKHLPVAYTPSPALL